ncbi:hypothetical protein [Lactococcus formosensis]|uniref:hypothetical protein n=1 Tax=Lactococcus formosensis TaxID=1281486 RepID=UPI003BAFB3F9
MVVLNDGSTDDSLAICEVYALLDSRIKVLTKLSAYYLLLKLWYRYCSGRVSCIY